ncbi:hypothetical protein V5N11_029215 [Cardamine amara subsp. amara]|uniref:Xylanase inhibitor N-terminal domain-containing protein n=1 Tax=Cardamine amara subsp. amara TaxID=228776 RepID=A0ABD1A931_CARAN
MHGLTISFLVFLSIFTSLTLKPKAQYLLPITKHEPTKQFYTTLNIGSAAKSPVKLILDLETNLSWLNCRNIKSLSTFRHVGCNTSLCKSLSNAHCKANTCYNRQPNPNHRSLRTRHSLFPNHPRQQIPRHNLRPQLPIPLRRSE